MFELEYAKAHRAGQHAIFASTASQANVDAQNTQTAFINMGKDFILGEEEDDYNLQDPAQQMDKDKEADSKEIDTAMDAYFNTIDKRSYGRLTHAEYRT